MRTEDQKKEHLFKMSTQDNQQSGIRINLFISTPIAILIGSVIISLAILVNGGIIRFKGSVATKSSTTQTAQAPTQPTQQAPQAPTGPVKVEVSDAPVLGDKNAKLTLIEFSDYECPFCKRSYDQLLPDLKKNYIDTGKLKLVYRNLPLPFHQNAHKEAEAALCARDQGGDLVYFKFHDQIFTKTTSNGTGLALDQLPVIAGNIGLNVSQFQSCLDTGKYKDYVDKDIAYATKVGANGTPTWFVGKSTSNGTIDGQIIVGAQPFSAFQPTIDNLLK